VEVAAAVRRAGPLDLAGRRVDLEGRRVGLS
jgi:hypothetical protein